MWYNRAMFRRRLTVSPAALCGLLVGWLLWGLALAAEVRRHEPDLWALRFRRVIACGLDYNGPPYAAQATIWLSCSEANSWQLWPLGR